MTGRIYSADHYFDDLPGGYTKNFNRALLGAAHGQCLRKFAKKILDAPPGYEVKIMSGIPGSGKSYVAGILVKDSPLVIVVDNTNISAWEISPYLNLALAFGHNVEIVRVNTPFEVCMQRQTHGVPTKTMKDMFKRFERKNVMPWWPVKEINGEG